jgi:hypothetical protein
VPPHRVKQPSSARVHRCRALKKFCNFCATTDKYFYAAIRRLSSHNFFFRRRYTARVTLRSAKRNAVEVAVTRSGDVFLASTKIAVYDKPAQLPLRLGPDSERHVYLKMDARASYRDVASVIEANIQDVTLLAESLYPPNVAPAAKN